MPEYTTSPFLHLSLFHELAVLIFVLKEQAFKKAAFFCSLATVYITDFNILERLYQNDNLMST